MQDQVTLGGCTKCLVNVPRHIHLSAVRRGPRRTAALRARRFPHMGSKSCVVDREAGISAACRRKSWPIWSASCQPRRSR